MLCDAVVPIVNGLAKEYQGKLDFKVVVFDEGDAQARIKKYGLDKHGMVITDQDDKLVWSESGHNQKAPGVRKAIDAALGG